jgi:hypothetical protein
MELQNLAAFPYQLIQLFCDRLLLPTNAPPQDGAVNYYIIPPVRRILHQAGELGRLRVQRPNENGAENQGVRRDRNRIMQNPPFGGWIAALRVV